MKYEYLQLVMVKLNKAKLKSEKVSFLKKKT